MKKPETFKELYKLVNPKDLLEVLDFCGINDHRDKEHSKLKREFSHKVHVGIKDNRGKNPICWNYELTDKHYETIIKSIQDFYYWGHQFSHIYSHIYQRVVNALEIPMEEITPIMDERIRDCNKCEFYGECDHQGSYIKDGKWCFESHLEKERKI